MLSEYKSGLKKNWDQEKKRISIKENGATSS